MFGTILKEGQVISSVMGKEMSAYHIGIPVPIRFSFVKRCSYWYLPMNQAAKNLGIKLHLKIFNKAR